MIKIQTFFKKLGWYSFAIIAIAIAILIVILAKIFNAEKPSENPIKDIIEDVKHEVDKVTLEAKIQEERARGAEQSRLDLLNAALAEPDSRRRREKLSKLL